MLEVRRLREERGWNQTQLAFHAGLATSVISQIENGKREPSARTLRKLADGLGVEVGDLFPKAETPLWSGEAPGRRSSAFGFREAREYLEDYCERWEKLLAEGGLDDHTLEEFLLTAEGWLPMLDIALSTEIAETTVGDEQPRTEIGRANRRYLELFSRVINTLMDRLGEGPDERLAAMSNVVRLQEYRDRLPNQAVG